MKLTTTDSDCFKSCQLSSTSLNLIGWDSRGQCFTRSYSSGTDDLPVDAPPLSPVLAHEVPSENTAGCSVKNGRGLFGNVQRTETYGSFMRMNTLAMKKLSRTLMPPMKSNRKRLSLGMFGALERSRMMKPRPPIVKRKLEASPSMMYCPFTLKTFMQKSSSSTSREKVVRIKLEQVGISSWI